ncbi:MAG: ssnA protein [Planctomycetota bacterium]|nr:MAG: ssnA protein [Planctomycetota bacterium]
MSVLLQNALLVDIDPVGVESASLRIDGDRIIERGATLKSHPNEECVDCDGSVVLPGMVNGHTHLYSSLAVGMPPPARTPQDFYEILKFVWWRLDRAHDLESVEASAKAGACDALRCGTTTLIDHHASPSAIAGSLDAIERAIAAVGLRGVLCYETTDRNGPDGRAAGLDENRRYLEKCKHVADGRFAGLVGAHASFTLEDETLGALAALAEQYGVGVHIHVAEDPVDEQDALTNRGGALIDRLARHFLLQPDAVFAHGTHLSPDAVARVNELHVTMAHNPRSNMNNAVGYAPISSFETDVMLGTDGIGGDMFAEARAAWLISRHQRAGLSPEEVVAMLAAAARRASRALGVTLGRLRPNAAADIVVTSYRPQSPLTAENVAGHLLFGMDGGHVRDVMIAGRWRWRGGGAVDQGGEVDAETTREIAAALWRRMQEIT